MSVKDLKRKGKSFEEDVAGTIHNFFLENNIEYKTLFEKIGNKNLAPQRDSSSGTLSNSFGDINLGLVLNHFPYSIECKNHASLTDLSVDSVLKGKIASLLKVFTEQTIPNCNRAATFHKTKLYPLQVFKGTRTATFCLFNIDNFMKDKATLPENYVKYQDLILCKFESFLELHKSESES